MNKSLNLGRINHVKPYRELRNKLKTIGTYKSNAPFTHLKTRADFLNAVQRFDMERYNRKSTAEKASLLWFLEKLIREARVFDNGTFLLREPALERFKPIMHAAMVDTFRTGGGVFKL